MSSSVVFVNIFTTEVRDHREERNNISGSADSFSAYSVPSVLKRLSVEIDGLARSSNTFQG